MKSKQQHLLIVDDEEDVREPIQAYLEGEGYRVSSVGDADQAIEIVKSDTPDLIVLDIVLGESDGFDLCRDIQKIADVAIIFLSGRSEETERIIGLEMGADDYLVKPFSPRELLARIRAVMRRYRKSVEVLTDVSKPLKIGPWTLKFFDQELVGDDGERVGLSTGEARLLRVFIEHPNQVMTREELLNKTQQRSATMFDRSIDNYISRIRKKIEKNPSKPRYLKTYWGGGYALNIRSD